MGATCKGDLAGGLNNKCCEVTISGQLFPQFRLQKLDNETELWYDVSTKYHPSKVIFDGLDPISDHGTYRVQIKLPDYDLTCDPEDHTQKTLMYNTSGQFIGYKGTLYGPNNILLVTNNVIVGPTNQSEIGYTFIDGVPDPTESAYDYGEATAMDASASINYDLYYFGLGENGPTYNRWKSQGWNTGQIQNPFSISGFWAQNNWQHETFHQYRVVFATENQRCRNGIEWPSSSWNGLERTFFICPAGSGCKFGIEEREIVLSPNPANTRITLQNFKPDIDFGYILTITDLSGRVVKNDILKSRDVDISDLPSGMFLVNITKDGNILLTSKLAVNH